MKEQKRDEADLPNLQMRKLRKGEEDQKKQIPRREQREHQLLQPHCLKSAAEEKRTLNLKSP